MRYQTLGETGVLVSELCLGTMTFGDGWGFGGIDTPAATRILDSALNAGINFVDTADVYSEGRSEEILGEAIRALSGAIASSSPPKRSAKWARV